MLTVEYQQYPELTKEIREHLTNTHQCEYLNLYCEIVNGKTRWVKQTHDGKGNVLKEEDW